MSTEQIRAVDKRREASRKRQALIRKLEAEWVGDSQLTSAELMANRDRLRAECMERHPDWGWIR